MEVVVMQMLVAVSIGVLTGFVLVLLDNLIKNRSTMVLVAMFVGYIFANVMDYVNLFFAGLR